VFQSIDHPLDKNSTVFEIKNRVILKNMRAYIKMRDTFDVMDENLSPVLTISSVTVIYSMMTNIYLTTLLLKVDVIDQTSYVMLFTTVSTIIAMVLMFFVCGIVHNKSRLISKALDRIETSVLTDSQYRDWLSFATICQKTSFGFTIGGFASLKKTTLIAVSNQ